jgi:hypothetical protein
MRWETSDEMLTVKTASCTATFSDRFDLTGPRQRRIQSNRLSHLLQPHMKHLKVIIFSFYKFIYLNSLSCTIEAFIHGFPCQAASLYRHFGGVITLTNIYIGAVTSNMHYGIL